VIGSSGEYSMEDILPLTSKAMHSQRAACRLTHKPDAKEPTAAVRGMRARSLGNPRSPLRVEPFGFVPHDRGCTDRWEAELRVVGLDQAYHPMPSEGGSAGLGGDDIQDGMGNGRLADGENLVVGQHKNMVTKVLCTNR
jgi:hypothetical protein